eukprot:TRINITY_DN1090_c0_g1_i7.p1 TRINITY_DN1090_c0_g1~~TRINITY_DN1090_c0_g1_i7.p1  ORF type:complete len:191 (-),score=18.61 TRINITY_DN1090_c0_g1_i7:361-933(-)
MHHSDASEARETHLICLNRYWFDLILDAFFVLDIYLNFKTPFYHDGSLVTNETRIGRRYVRSWLSFDVFVAFPFELLQGFTPDTSHTALFRVLKPLRVFRLYNYLTEMESRGDRKGGYLGATKLIFSVLLLAHWLGCIWWLIAEGNGFSAATWVQSEDVNPVGDFLNKEPPFNQFTRSFYWAVTTLTSVG